MDCSLPGSFVHGASPVKNTGVGCHALLQGIFPTQGSKERSPAFQADSLLSEPPGKPKNTAMGEPNPSEGNFPSQELNQGLLHFRGILYQLSYQEALTRTAAAAAKLLQSCPTLCDPIDGSPPDPPIPGILQARTLE